jgi:NAD-dependent deacetylase
MAYIEPAQPIVVLTGAGISVESGLPTYRGPEGLWEGRRLDEVATPEAHARDPDLVLRFYNERRRRLRAPEVRPNVAHRALAEIEAFWPGGVLVVTQNIDDLHERAGTRSLIHMHGELLKVRCTACGEVHAWLEDCTTADACPGCGAPGCLRPHVVWFGEIPMEVERIQRALLDCGLFVAVGTSGTVYPAAGFVQEVRAMGRAHTIEINPEASSVGSMFAEARRGGAVDEVPALARELRAVV